MLEITSDVLSFWFATDDHSVDAAAQKFWFQSTPELDRDITERFGEILNKARAGDYDDQLENAEDYLALVIVMDQFPRNIHRGTPDAFASDPKALATAKAAIAKGLDMDIPAPNRRTFMYLPFEHAENLADQDDAVRLISAMGDDNFTRYAEAHRDVIREFGRFPHRNEILGRTSTPEELEYLSKPGAGF